MGDLQGTFDPIEDPASPLAGGLRDDTLYIFCGDLFDRGVQNDKVARWWLPDDMIVVNDLPHTATGKISKKDLRERFSDYVLET